MVSATVQPPVVIVGALDYHPAGTLGFNLRLWTRSCAGYNVALIMWRDFLTCANCVLAEDRIVDLQKFRKQHMKLQDVIEKAIRGKVQEL